MKKDELVEAKLSPEGKDAADFVNVILEKPEDGGRAAGSQTRQSRILVSVPWPGERVCAEGR